jgi:hypothetical protein
MPATLFSPEIATVSQQFEPPAEQWDLLENHPEVSDAFNGYVKNSWNLWAAKQEQWLDFQERVYSPLFNTHRAFGKGVSEKGSSFFCVGKGVILLFVSEKGSSFFLTFGKGVILLLESGPLPISVTFSAVAFLSCVPPMNVRVIAI